MLLVIKGKKHSCLWLIHHDICQKNAICSVISISYEISTMWHNFLSQDTSFDCRGHCWTYMNSSRVTFVCFQFHINLPTNLKCLANFIVHFISMRNKKESHFKLMFMWLEPQFFPSRQFFRKVSIKRKIVYSVRIQLSTQNKIVDFCLNNILFDEKFAHMKQLSISNRHQSHRIIALRSAFQAYETDNKWN